MFRNLSFCVIRRSRTKKPKRKLGNRDFKRIFLIHFYRKSNLTLNLALNLTLNLNLKLTLNLILTLNFNLKLTLNLNSTITQVFT